MKCKKKEDKREKDCFVVLENLTDSTNVFLCECKVDVVADVLPIIP